MGRHRKDKTANAIDNVSFVIDMKTLKRVSKYFTRSGDAKRKSREMRSHSGTNRYKVYTAYFRVANMVDEEPECIYEDPDDINLDSEDKDES